MQICPREELRISNHVVCSAGRCGNMKTLLEGKCIHAHIIKTQDDQDTFVGNNLVNMYAKCGSLDDARQVFRKMPEQDLVSWNAMIAGYAKWHAQNGNGEEALKLFVRMQRAGMKSDQFTFGSVLRACASLACLEAGMQVHSQIIKTEFESDVFAGSALVDMYAKCGCLGDAHELFNRMPERNGVSWTAMVAGYAQKGHVDEALKLFNQMQQSGIKPNQYTFSTILMACASIGALEQGKEVHTIIAEFGFESDLFVCSALVDMYAKCGSIENALRVFEKMSKRNVVSWNAMIAGYRHNGRVEQALQLFYQMQRGGIKPTEVTFASVLRACASLTAMEQGKRVHNHIIKTGFEVNVFVGSALVYMYAKCGSIKDARHVFDKTPAQNVVTWNALIAGYAQNGNGKEALQLFEQMQLKNIRPNHITFVSVLFACSHAGLLDDGQHYFHSMSRDHGITPAVEHYACMIDLLGRAGRLDDAESLIYKMSVNPGAFVWRTLLGACTIRGDMERGKRAVEHVLELEPQDSATYVLLSNIYAAAGRWDDVAKVRKMMKNNGVIKERACSWIEVKDKVHTFVVRDRSHPQTEKIYAKLAELTRLIKEAGYVPDINGVLYDVENERKEHLLLHHSEKLAIAFGLISTAWGAPIRIAKNLRVCDDCHTFAKYISKILARELIVRDANRFHHFEDGICSWRDYW
eukprot:Gb_22668 [translate_table: standard]